MMREKKLQDINPNEIELSEFLKEVYFIKAFNSENLYTKKVIIE